MPDKSAYNDAIRLLARRDHSQLELKQKLRTKGHTAEDIQTALTALTQSGMLNEARFIENYIHWRRTRGYGPDRIKQELQTRGISTEMIAEQLEITDNAWFIAIRKVWHKHFKGKLPADFRDKAKQMRFLQYRGFTQTHIESVFGNNDDIY